MFFFFCFKNYIISQLPCRAPSCQAQRAQHTYTQKTFVTEFQNMFKHIPIHKKGNFTLIAKLVKMHAAKLEEETKKKPATTKNNNKKFTS